MGVRLERYGKWAGWTCVENVDYGKDKGGREVVLSWVVDDAVQSRAHRLNLFRADTAVIGLGASEHATHGGVFVANIAGGFEEDDPVEQNLVHGALAATYRAQK